MYAVEEIKTGRKFRMTTHEVVTIAENFIGQARVDVEDALYVLTSLGFLVVEIKVF